MRTKYYAMSARVFGVLGVLAALGMAVIGTLPSVDFAPWGVALCVFVAALSWVSLIRPVMILDEHEVRLRQMLEDVTIPLAQVREFSVRQVGRLRLEDGRVFTTAAVTRSRSQIQSDAGAPQRSGRLERIGSGLIAGGGTSQQKSRSYGWHVEETVFQRLQTLREATDAGRATPGTPGGFGGTGAQPGVLRRPAWLELAVLTASAAVTVVLIIVG